MISSNLSNIGLKYCNEVYNICNELDMQLPRDYVYQLFNTKLSHLRDKFNKNGEIDFQQEALYLDVGNARANIGEVHFWARFNLVQFTEIYNEHGNFGIRDGFNRQDYWFFRSLDNSYHSLYQCWQQIANTLNLFFQVIDNPRKVYFFNVLSNLTKKWQS